MFVAAPIVAWASIQAPAHAQAPAGAPPPAPVSPPPADKLPESVIAPPAPPPPAPEPAGDPKQIDSGFALRVGGRVQGATATSRGSLNDFGLDEIYAEARFSVALSLTPLFAWQFNLNAIYDSLGGTGSAGIMDVIVKFEPIQEFHLWAGRMLVPSDRSNFSGPWFMSPWKYTGADMRFRSWGRAPRRSAVTMASPPGARSARAR